jgi:hypothetical protein
MAATKVVDFDRREKAAEMLAEGRSITAIAEELGVDRTNVWRWLKRPEVAEHYLACVNTRAADLVKPAIEWMESALKGEDVPPAVKVAIARLAFERADKFQAIKDRVLAEKPENNNATSEEPQWKQAPWAFMDGGKK